MACPGIYIGGYHCCPLHLLGVIVDLDTCWAYFTPTISLVCPKALFFVYTNEIDSKKNTHLWPHPFMSRQAAYYVCHISLYFQHQHSTPLKNCLELPLPAGMLRWTLWVNLFSDIVSNNFSCILATVYIPPYSQLVLLPIATVSFRQTLVLVFGTLIII